MNVHDHGNSYSLEFELDIGVGSGVLDPAEIGKHDWELLAPQLSWAQLKLNEADYHLKVLRFVIQNEAAAHYQLNAFATALCAVDDVMRNETQPDSDAREWWEEKRRVLRECPAYQAFRNLRNRAVHRGLKPPGLAYAMTFREHHDGGRTLETGVELVTADGRSIEDPIGVATRALETVRDLLAEADELGHLGEREKPGHAVDLRFEKEVEPGRWETVSPEEMDMFGRQMPHIDLARPKTNTQAGEQDG